MNFHTRRDAVRSAARGVRAAGRAAIVTLATAALLAGCASPAPAPVLLTLPPVGASTTLPTPRPGGPVPTLAVRRVGIPEYLVARRVRYRSEASTLAEWPNTYWAERIEIGVSREFMAALRPQLPGWSLCDTGCGDHSPGLSLQLDLLRMDYLRSARTLQARARITLSDGAAPPRLLTVQEIAYELPTDADTAQAQAQAIAELIRQVAQAAASMVDTARR